MFRRSTRDIVVSRSRLKQEAQEAAEKQASMEELVSEPVPDEDDTKIYTVSKDRKKEETTMKFQLPRWSYWAIGSVAVLVLLVLLLGGKSGIPEGMRVAAVPDTALSGSAAAGDVVQLYGPDGAVIPELRYVSVYGADAEGLLVLLEPVQMEALASQERVTAALAARSGAQAEELLSLQSAILRPEVTLELPRTIALEPGKTADAELTVRLDPADGITPKLSWKSSDESVFTVENGKLTAGAVGDATLTVSCGDVSASCTVAVRVSLTALALDKTEGVLVAGESLTLTATPEPGDATGFTVSWVSNDTDVATVTGDGTVTGVGPGKATIIASCGDVVASCEVRVGVHTELVQFTARDVTVASGETVKLEYAVSPADNNIDAATYTSSDENVLTVDADGVVTGVGTGTATVTISHGSATDTCTVTVS